MSRVINLGVVSLFLLSIPSVGSASSWFVGYDVGQMAFNEFKYVAGEVGYNFENDHALRLAVFNVALSERHLSSNEASVVDGDDVEGLWQGVDLYYDYPITRGIFVSPSIGYHDQTFTHTVLGTSVDHASLSAGFALSYLAIGMLSFENIYTRFSLNFGYKFKDLDDTILGDSTVHLDPSSLSVAFSIGYKFD